MKDQILFRTSFLDPPAGDPLMGPIFGTDSILWKKTNTSNTIDANA